MMDGNGGLRGVRGVGKCERVRGVVGRREMGTNERFRAVECSTGGADWCWMALYCMYKRCSLISGEKAEKAPREQFQQRPLAVSLMCHVGVGLLSQGM